MSRLAILACLVCTSALYAEMQTRELSYTFEDTQFSGTVTWSDAHTDKRPAILMVPNWMGPTAGSLEKAKLLAADRYVIFMCDMYGTTVRPTNAQEAGAAAGALRADRPMMRRRANEALKQFLALATDLPIDADKTAAIGFCFGGGTVLEMARSGTAIDAVVSFHGNLDTPLPASEGKVNTSILVCHGADDPIVPREQVTAFEGEMTAAKADWQFMSYGGAVHSFTNPAANSAGRSQYHETVCTRSFALMHSFLAERFAAD